VPEAPADTHNYGRQNAAWNNLDTVFAPLNSPVFSGDPKAPTPAAGDSDNSLATTAFVQAAIAAAAIPSCSVVFTLLAAAPFGWLMFDDTSIGDASSGAAHAGANAQTVFTALYAIPDAICPIQTSSGAATTRAAQGTAAAAWANHCRMALPKALGRALAVAGAGASLSARALGQPLGEEVHALTANEQASMTVSGGTGAAIVSLDVRTIQVQTAGGEPVVTVSEITPTTAGLSVSGAAAGGGGAHNNMPPTLFLNAMIKL
jgi:hypothetical protein